MKNKEDPSAFTILCIIGLLHFVMALCNLGARINLMPLSVYKKLSLVAPKSDAMRLLMDDRNVKSIILDCVVVLRMRCDYLWTIEM